MSRIYYAQNREDIILESFFIDKKKGFYVDVGAYDPDDDSVTKLFYNKGWTGINIEPQPNRFKKFLKKRPRDTNLNIGISDKEGVLELRSYKNEGLSTFSEKIKNEYSAKTQKNSDTNQYTDIEIQIKTLEKVFDEQHVSSIDFLKIDVEGFEYEVIKGNNWKKYRPKVLCIEANHIAKDWRLLLKKNDYNLVFNDGLNDYYVDNKPKDKPLFRYVDHVVLSLGGGVRYADHIAVHNEYEKSNFIIKKQDEHIKKQDEHIKKQDEHIKKIESDLEKYSKKIVNTNRIRNILTNLKTGRDK